MIDNVRRLSSEMPCNVSFRVEVWGVLRACNLTQSEYSEQRSRQSWPALNGQWASWEHWLDSLAATFQKGKWGGADSSQLRTLAWLTSALAHPSAATFQKGKPCLLWLQEVTERKVVGKHCARIIVFCTSLCHSWTQLRAWLVGRHTFCET